MKKPDYMTLKIVLRGTDISRTIVVPGGITLSKLSDVIMGVFGWCEEHLWEFQADRDLVYADPSEYDDAYAGGCERRDSGKTTVAKVLPVRGAKLLYTYDMGDGWEHQITRMADPKEPGVRCTKTSGTYGIEDIGGCWGLMDFTEKLKEYDANPKAFKDDDFMGLLEWSGFDNEEARKEFLACPTIEELTKILEMDLGQ